MTFRWNPREHLALGGLRPQVGGGTTARRNRSGRRFSLHAFSSGPWNASRNCGGNIRGCYFYYLWAASRSDCSTTG